MGQILQAIVRECQECLGIKEKKGRDPRLMQFVRDEIEEMREWERMRTKEWRGNCC